jgi:hypothetical protein
MTYPVAKQGCISLFLYPFTLRKIIIPLNTSFISPIHPREAFVQNNEEVYKGEQQSGSLVIKCDMLASSLSKDLPSWDCKRPLGHPCKCSKLTSQENFSLPKRKKAERNSFLTELTQRKKIILFFWEIFMEEK